MKLGFLLSLALAIVFVVASCAAVVAASTLAGSSTPSTRLSADVANDQTDLHRPGVSGVPPRDGLTLVLAVVQVVLITALRPWRRSSTTWPPAWLAASM